MTHQATPVDETAKVTILMGVRNGAAHLAAQLDSIASQTHQNWHLICSDDGSTDSSKAILRDFGYQHPGRLSLLDGPKQGFSANYMSLIASMTTKAGYVCFADQDDVWLPGKISRALHMMSGQSGRPALYCGRHFDWYPAHNRCEASPKCLRPYSLRNALIENIASGNTVMLNPAAVALAQRTAGRIGPVFAHDWWLYLLLTGSGGHIFFDNGPPQILYRQHPSNLVGAGRSLRMQIQRKIGVVKGTFSDRVSKNLQALSLIKDELTPEAQHTIAAFSAARQKPGFTRLAALHNVAPYRQGWLGTLGFWGAASLGKV